MGKKFRIIQKMVIKKLFSVLFILYAMKISANTLLLIQIQQIQFLFLVVIIISIRLKKLWKFVFIKKKKSIYNYIIY